MHKAGDLKNAGFALDALRMAEHGGDIHRARGICGKDILDFSANINPLGLPPNLKGAILANLNLILHYPDPEAKRLTQTIARYWEVHEENVLVGNGSTELIYLIAQAIRPKGVLIPSPTFSEYERSARTVDARLWFIKLREGEGFRLKLNRLCELGTSDGGSTSISSSTSDGGLASINSPETAIFFCNPNNPTGNLLFNEPKDVLGRFPGRFVIVDEAFMDFLPDEPDYTLVKEATSNKRLIVLRTLTKLFALPGLRLGYLVAAREVVRRLKRFKVPWSVNSLAQVAGAAILKDPEFIERTRTLIAKERAFFTGQIRKIEGLKSYPSVTNFVLIKIVRNRLTSSELQLRLFSKGILIRNCSNFRGLNNRFFRVAIRTHGENCRLLKNLRNVCKT